MILGSSFFHLSPTYGETPFVGPQASTKPSACETFEIALPQTLDLSHRGNNEIFPCLYCLALVNTIPLFETVS